MKDNKVDLVVMDELPAKEIVNNNSGLKIVSGALTSDSYGMIVKKDNQIIYNQALYKIIVDENDKTREVSLKLFFLK